MNFKKMKIAVAVALGVTTLTGCMGQMGVTQLVTFGNLKAVDNRYGRAGLYILLAPVYGISAAADLFIFNSIEFWTGKNIITGKSPAIVDKDVGGAVFKVNDKIDASMTKAPVAPLQVNNKVKSTTVEQIDANTLEMHVALLDGTQQVLRGEKVDDSVAFYLDGKHITTVQISELENYVAATQA
ncbi:DUF3332 family protein [Aliivibrio fischeri]|uniref:DUF3332 domain-containing protein n=1 Tax=Aliivibrio fischeri TaxID=668 RepID=UPI0012D9EEAE|nr:DUF3332 domain-containing protein [Aliivibrio fischeri]MUK62746.1 DUF3332 family protein [Aliivibrio fischeri]MUK78601.1 DUF3332 family protein [Aliivibrio fischeri]MUL22354.1 DUF3332 family protein [Aliivibrio fischeri]MUL26145.1 DUF3332 family protein [Aliivibrio fischeri]